MHGLNGYREVIESVIWGIRSLGHEVTDAVNSADPDALNIIFGAQVLPVSFMETLPKNTIVYNFEQLRGLDKEEIRPEIHFIARNFAIWEYSRANLDSWKLLGARDPILVPVSYSPNLTRIPKFPVQDIDVLIYGLSGEKRLEAFHALSQAGLVVAFVSGLYGEARDILIARSKIILNVNLYDFSRIFEIVRVSYLLANKKAVVCVSDSDTYFEEEFLSAVKLTPMKTLVETVSFLLENDGERQQLETSGYEIFSKRNIQAVLREVLSNY